MRVETSKELRVGGRIILKRVKEIGAVGRMPVGTCVGFL
jgi:hypothetical protein